MKAIIANIRNWYTRTYRWLVDRNRAVKDSGVSVVSMPVIDAVEHTLSCFAEALLWFGPSLLAITALSYVSPVAGFLGIVFLIRPQIINNFLFEDIEFDDLVGSFGLYSN